jgi:YVTN family beta-propeller protein
VVKSFPVGASPQWPVMTPDEHTLLVPNQGGASVTPVDVDRGTVGTSVAVGSAPISVAITPDGGSAYVTNLGSNTVTELAIARSADGATTLSRVRDIPVGAGPMSVAITPDGDTAVVSLNGAGAVQTIDLDTNAVSAPIAVGGQPEDVVLSPDGGTAYVANWALNAVTQVDLATRTVRETYHTGSNPNGLGISPDGRFVFAANQGGQTVTRLDVASPPTYATAPVVEDWHLRPTAGGKTLSWTITQRWTDDFAVELDAHPSLALTPGITDTLWYRPDELHAANPDTQTAGQFFTQDFEQATNSTDTWATYKLWSKHHLQSDPRIGVEGGHLVRRLGHFAEDAALGARFDSEGGSRVAKGTTRSLTLRITPEDKFASGQQLAVDIPDRETSARLRDLYQSILNGGAVAGQSRYLLGNESGGYLTAYQALFDGAAMAAGVPGERAPSAVPYRFEEGFRDYLQAVLDDVDSEGATRFGLSGGVSWGGSYQDANLHTLLGVHDYVVYSGDLGFARRNQATLERMLRLWLNRMQANGLVLSHREDGSYYDAMFFGSTYFSTYINALVHGALLDMADLEQALADQASEAGDQIRAAQSSDSATAYTEAAARLKQGMNRELWTPDSPHGPMYADWINRDSGEKAYAFMSSAQYTPIVYGVASPEQARQIFATADPRYAELAAAHGYQGHGALTALWPVPDEANYLHWPFGYYMNGGILHYETYFEVVARAMAGDGDGAFQRLKRFADGFAATSWWGSNAANIDGSVPQGGEPYLQDMVMVPAALVQGTLGVRQTWKQLTVAPRLPGSWDHAAADIRYKGRPYCVSVDRGAATTKAGPCRHAS